MHLRKFASKCLNLIAFFLFIFLLGCNGNGIQLKDRSRSLQEWKEPNGKIKVLTTIGMISDLVKMIGDGHVDAFTLIQGELDPHTYQIVKGDDEKFSFAQLIFYNGLGLEHGPSLQHRLMTHSHAVAIGNNIQKKFPQKMLYYNGQLDPHIWMDVSLWAESIPLIVEALTIRDPSHAEDYQKNGEEVYKNLQNLHASLRSSMESIPQEKRYLITSHDAFNYFTRAYLSTEEERMQGTWQKRFAAPEGLAPDSQLSSEDIRIILDHMAQHQIQVLFPESNISKASIKKIISSGNEKGLNLHIAETHLYADAMGPPGSDGDSYLKMMQHNASTLIKWLSGL